VRTNQSARDFENDLRLSSQIVAEYRRSLEDAGSHDALPSLVAVHYRGGQQELQLGVDYARSDDPLDRITGARILGQLGLERYSFLDPTLDQLISMLDDTDVRVVADVAEALGHRQDVRAIPHLTSFIAHEDSGVRFGVVRGLSGHEEIAAIRGLIVLSRDQDDEVRNWALCGLGSFIEADTPEIRDALFRGASDPHDEARGEALLGLASRGDRRVVELLQEEIERESVGRLALCAAAEIADSRLVEPLKRLKGDLEFDEKDLSDKWYQSDLDDAIARCSDASLA
jgi:HEAT repeat protein